ncbi:MAG TPA: cyclophane-forming radical SAM/SPASM peptide maturase GrrM/OscB [Polyangiaceae bacterium]|nr:cyclophane-forming radical SAM/SPASM peptide maturase GrrM/OscB [Polyangiaceae bacterium]
MILQPTPFCNIDCQYCYLPNRSSKERMSDEVIVAAMNRVAESGLVGREMTIVWHAGEPLVLSPEWYRHAIELIDARTPKGVEITFSIQTNAMLVDDAWCAFIRENPRIQIGVSVDGPAVLHDARRKTRSGKGTLAQALRGIAKLRENDIPFHAITVLTAASLEFPDELHEFYEDNGIVHVGFNVEEIEGGHTKSSLLAKDADRRYRAFMRRFLELVDEHGGRPVVREADMAFGMMHAAKTDGEMRDQQNSPWAIVSVGVDGAFTTFSPELIGVQSKDYGDFMLGNVLRDSFADAMKSPRFVALDADIEAGVAACRASCPYFDACGGGAPANKYFENGSMRSTETLYCRLTKKALIDVCREFLAARAA